MDEPLESAPCIYLSFVDDGCMVQMNGTLRKMLDVEGQDLSGRHVDSLLTAASRVFFQTHLLPMVLLHGKAEEVYLSFRGPDDAEVPVLLNAVRRFRDGRWVSECIAMPMRRRDEYENEILSARRDAEVALREKDVVNAELERLSQVLEAKQIELVRANTSLATLAATDPLTGLKNRRAFDDELAHNVAIAERFGLPLSFLLVDLDRFKLINDTFGHVAGDEVLRSLAPLLKARLRAVDIAARYGGEEFAVLLPGTPLAGALVVADKIRRDVESAPWEGKQVTISVGVAAFDLGGDGSVLVHQADDALYRAKAAGRNRVVTYSRSPSSSVRLP